MKGKVCVSFHLPALGLPVVPAPRVEKPVSSPRGLLLVVAYALKTVRIPFLPWEFDTMEFKALLASLPHPPFPQKTNSLPFLPSVPSPVFFLPSFVKENFQIGAFVR